MRILPKFWPRVTFWNGRGQTGKYVLSLESEIERLRQENRALVNSILGIAGIPPIHVDRSSERAREAAEMIATESAQSAPRSATDSTCDPEKVPALGHSESARADDESAPRQGSFSCGRSAIDRGAPPPANTAASADSLGSRSRVARGGSPRNDSPHSSPQIRPVAPPHRRRSWHQINRILEIESARRKEVTSGE